MTTFLAAIEAPAENESTEWTAPRGLTCERGSESVERSGLGILSVEPLIREVFTALNADAVTVAVRRRGDERLLVCTSDGRVREANGSLSLGLISRGPTKLAGGAGLLQAVECCTLFGFAPSGYLGAPFNHRLGKFSGGIAAWSRRPRRWAVADGRLLRRFAVRYEEEMQIAERIVDWQSADTPGTHSR